MFIQLQNLDIRICGKLYILFNPFIVFFTNLYYILNTHCIIIVDKIMDCQRDDDG